MVRFGFVSVIVAEGVRFLVLLFVKGSTKSCGCYRSEHARAIITKYGNRNGRPKRKDKVNG